MDKRKATKVVKTYTSTLHPSKRLLCGKTRGVVAVQRVFGLPKYSQAVALVRECRRKDLIGGDE